MIKLANNSTKVVNFDVLPLHSLSPIPVFFANCGTCHNLKCPVFIDFFLTVFPKMWHVPHLKAGFKLRWIAEF